jgi:signal peptidase II
MRRSNAWTFWPVLAAVAVADGITKWLAVNLTRQLSVPRGVFGDWMRFTVVHNPGAAFGLQFGEYSRWIFMVLTLVALLILGLLYRSTRPGDFARTLSLALVCGGAVGNLVDRVRSHTGVVDFIDVGFGDSRWPTFNVADMAVSVGAFLLAWVLWGDEPDGETVNGVPALTSAPTPRAEMSGEV